MKNPHYENLKRSAKLYHRHSRRQRFQNGIVVRHLYDEQNPEKLSWWDDVVFVLNDYLVNVAWRHPRYAYKDEVERQAYDNCVHLRSPSSESAKDAVDSMFDRANPNYVKVGKSRKKIRSYTMNRTRDDGYYEDLRQEEYRIARDPNNGVIITPSMTAEWTNWSRFVSICAPIEVRGVPDLHKLADLTKRLLKRETSLESEFLGYSYCQKDWVSEIEQSAPVGVLSHAVNI